MENREITNKDIMQELKQLHREIDNVRRMVYEVNADYFDTAQAANFDNRYPFEIIPLTNRELILNAMSMTPVIDAKTGREKLVPRDKRTQYYGFVYNNNNDTEDELN